MKEKISMFCHVPPEQVKGYSILDPEGGGGMEIKDKLMGGLPKNKTGVGGHRKKWDGHLLISRVAYHAKNRKYVRRSVKFSICPPPSRFQME